MFELAMVNEPSVFELLRFDCIYMRTEKLLSDGPVRAD